MVPLPLGRLAPPSLRLAGGPPVVPPTPRWGIYQTRPGPGRVGVHDLCRVCYEDLRASEFSDEAWKPRLDKPAKTGIDGMLLILDGPVGCVVGPVVGLILAVIVAWILRLLLGIELAGSG